MKNARVIKWAGDTSRASRPWTFELDAGQLDCATSVKEELQENKDLGFHSYWPFGTKFSDFSTKISAVAPIAIETQSFSSTKLEVIWVPSLKLSFKSLRSKIVKMIWILWSLTLSEMKQAVSGEFSVWWEATGSVQLFLRPNTSLWTFPRQTYDWFHLKIPRSVTDKTNEICHMGARWCKLWEQRASHATSSPAAQNSQRGRTFYSLDGFGPSVRFALGGIHGTFQIIHFFRREDGCGTFCALFATEGPSRSKKWEALLTTSGSLPEIIHHHVLLPFVLIIRWHKSVVKFLFSLRFQFKTLWRAFDEDFIVIPSLVVRPFLRYSRLMSRTFKSRTCDEGRLPMRE